MSKVAGKILLQAQSSVEYFDLQKKSWHRLETSNSYFSRLRVYDQNTIEIPSSALEAIEAAFMADHNVVFQSNPVYFDKEFSKIATDLIQQFKYFPVSKSSNSKSSFSVTPMNITRKTLEFLIQDTDNESFEDEQGLVYVRPARSKEPYQVFRVNETPNRPNVNNAVDGSEIKNQIREKIQKINISSMTARDCTTILNFIQSQDFDPLANAIFDIIPPVNTEDTPLLLDNEISFVKNLIFLYLGKFLSFYDYNFMKNCSIAIDANMANRILSCLSDYFGYPLVVNPITTADGYIIRSYQNPRSNIQVKIDFKSIGQFLRKHLTLEKIQMLDFDKIQNQIQELCLNRISLKHYIQSIIKSSIKSVDILEFDCCFGTFLRMVADKSAAYYAVLPRQIDHSQNNISGNIYPLTKTIVEKIHIHDLPTDIENCNFPTSDFLKGRNELQVANYFTTAMRNAIFCNVTGQLYEPAPAPTINLGW